MIYTDGCLPKASQWFERHILPVAIVIAVLAVLQVDFINKEEGNLKSLIIRRFLEFVLLKIFAMIFSLRKLNGHGKVIP